MLWPPPLIESGRPCSRAALTQATTSATPRQRAIERRTPIDHGVPDRAGVIEPRIARAQQWAAKPPLQIVGHRLRTVDMGGLGHRLVPRFTKGEGVHPIATRALLPAGFEIADRHHHRLHRTGLSSSSPDDDVALRLPLPAGGAHFEPQRLAAWRRLILEVVGLADGDRLARGRSDALRRPAAGRHPWRPASTAPAPRTSAASR